MVEEDLEKLFYSKLHLITSSNNAASSFDNILLPKFRSSTFKDTLQIFKLSSRMNDNGNTTQVKQIRISTN